METTIDTEHEQAPSKRIVPKLHDLPAPANRNPSDSKRLRHFFKRSGLDSRQLMTSVYVHEQRYSIRDAELQSAVTSGQVGKHPKIEHVQLRAAL